jgi:CheY-like chemotaxis protein
VARVHDGFVAKWEEHSCDGAHQRRVVSARQVSPSDRAGEERIPDEEMESRSSLFAHLKADTTRTVARRMMDANLIVAKFDRRRIVEVIDRWLPARLEAEHRRLLDDALVKKEIVPMEIDGHVLQRVLGDGDTGDMIDVSVRQEHTSHVELGIANGCQQLVHLVSGIDQHRLSRSLATDDEAVLVEWRNCANLDNHEMILCAIDDLIFSIKISTAARQLGADIFFERTANRVLPSIRDKQPSLVIFDLNSARMDPLGTIRALKSDPELQSIRTLGYVSHVDSETIAAARSAGVDQVLARSAFAERLSEILTGA